MMMLILIIIIIITIAREIFTTMMTGIINKIIKMSLGE